MIRLFRSLIAPATGAAAVAFSGCVSEGVPNAGGVPVTEVRPDQPGFVSGTGVESQDLVSISDRMAKAILGVPEIARAKTAPHVVLDPVVNNTRFPIDKDIFLIRIRTQLNSRSMGKVRFLDRDTMRALERERDIRLASERASGDTPPAAGFRGADFVLSGKLDGISTRTSQGTSDYILYSFRLTDARTSEIVWEDTAEIKKQGLEDAAYR